MVAPATPYDAKGLLIAAIRDPDPVIFMEHKRLYMEQGEKFPNSPTRCRSARRESSATAGMSPWSASKRWCTRLSPPPPCWPTGESTQR